MSDEWTEADDVVEEVRKIRRRIFAELDNDPEKIGAHYMELDKQYTGRMIKPPSAEQEGRSAA